MKLRQRGFSLVELMIVVAITGILAVIAFAGFTALQSNSTFGGAVMMLQVELQGLRSKALAEQRDHVVVLVNGDGTGCSLVNAKGCTRYFLLADPDPAAWSFAAFNPESPGTNVGAVLERETLNRVFLSLAAEGKAGPPPFASVKVFDPLYKHTCASALCVAFRFQANGDVFGEMPGGGTQKRGNAVALVTDLEGQTGGAEKRILLVGFPNGIIKTYPY